MPSSPFSSGYLTARDRFRSAATRLGWAGEALATGAVGPSGEALTIDVATSGDATDGRAFVVSSGTHGVEGFFGSAVQVALLERWAETRVPSGIRWVFVHAVNPFGFAWLRRVDENNVDLNRNFLRDDEAFAGAPPEYVRLNELLNPEHAPYPRDGFRLEALKAAVRYGVSAMRRAVAIGQYEFPAGLFFGGYEASAAQRVLHDGLPRWIEGCRDVVHFDLHTGLGRWAECRLLVDYALTETTSGRVADLFDGEIYDTADSGRLTYRARGAMGAWCVARAHIPSYVFAFAEVGTYGGLRTIEALRAENQAHHWAAPDARELATAKARLKEVFCPADVRWRTRSLAAVAGTIERVASRLSPS